MKSLMVAAMMMAFVATASAGVFVPSAPPLRPDYPGMYVEDFDSLPLGPIAGAEWNGPGNMTSVNSNVVADGHIGQGMRIGIGGGDTSWNSACYAITDAYEYDASMELQSRSVIVEIRLDSMAHYTNITLDRVIAQLRFGCVISPTDRRDFAKLGIGIQNGAMVAYMDGYGDLETGYVPTMELGQWYRLRLDFQRGPVGSDNRLWGFFSDVSEDVAGEPVWHQLGVNSVQANLWNRDCLWADINATGEVTIDNFMIHDVPEPMTMLLLSLGGVLGLRRRK